jgi:hypothetical protein
MEAALAGRAQPAQIHQAVMVLAGNGALAPAQPDGADPAVARASEAINRHLEARARGSGDVSYLASPTVAGGVTVGRFQQLFLAARRAGAKDAGAMARSAWTVLAAQGQRLVKDGKTLESEQDNIAELTQQAEAFLAGVGRMLEALGVTR